MIDKKGWEKKKLGEICTTTSGGTPNRSNNSYFTGTIPWVKSGELDKGLILDTEEKITEEALKNSSAKVFPKGTLLIALYGATIGKLAFLGIDACTNQAICGIYKNDNIDSNFLYYFLFFKKPSLINKGIGGGQPNISQGILKDLKIPVPPLPIQQQIVSELDILSDIISKKKQQLADLDTLAQATFYDMFGDPVSNEKGWEMKKLGKLGILGRGVSKNRPRNSPDLLGGVTPLIQTGEIANAGMYLKEYNQTYSQKGLEQSKLWPKNTLCITIAANIGKTSILTFDACFPDSIVGFTPNLEIIDIIFVYYFFSCIQKELEDNAPQVAQKNINLEILNKINTILPPLSLQKKFTERIELIEEQKSLIYKSIEDAQHLFDYTMDRYFN